MRTALVRVVEVAVLGALPLIALAIGLSTFSSQDRVALDFHHELYPQAKLVVDGHDPYPPPDADLSDGTNTIWPIAAVLPVIPLTVLSPDTADWVATAIVLASLIAALWVLGIGDWRVYGITLLWAPVIDAYQTANATLPLALLVALTWRYRDRRLLAGASLAVALAGKFFLWPVAVWLFATGRRLAAAMAVGGGAAALLLLLPFIGFLDYVQLIRNLSETFDEVSYTPYALLVDLGAPSGPARALTFLLGAAILALAWRRRSLGLAIGAALVFSPIVWRHFFALLVVPLAIAHRRLDPIWAIPLAFWLVPGTYNGDTWQTALALLVLAVTLAAAERRIPELSTGVEVPPAVAATPAGRRSRAPA